MTEKNNTPSNPNNADDLQSYEPKTYQEFIDEEFKIIGPLDEALFKTQKAALKAASFIGLVGVVLSHHSRTNVSNILAIAGAVMLYYLSDFREKRQKMESQIKNFCSAHVQFFEKEIQSAPSSAEQKKLVHMANNILNSDTVNYTSNIARNIHVFASGCLLGKYFFDHLSLGTLLIAEALISTATNVFRQQEAKKHLTHIQKQLPPNIKIPRYDKQNT